MPKVFTLTVLLVLFIILNSHAAAQVAVRSADIPADLVINLSLGGTVQFSSQYTYSIFADGIVRLADRSNYLPRTASLDNLLLLRPGQKPPKPRKPPELRERIPEKLLLDLIVEFDHSGFYQMNDRYYGDPDLKEGSCTDHADEKGLSITMNGKTKSVSFFLGCSYGQNSPLKRFLVLYDEVSKALKGVKVTP